MRIFIFLILLISSLSAKSKVALLIGNQDYRYYPALSTAKNDVTTLSKMLEDMGFKVNILINASQRDMDRILSKFKRDSFYADISLVYYSGHGMAIGGENYLIPIDAPKAEYESSRYKLIPLDEIIDISSGARSSIILIDASRDIFLLNKFEKGLVPIEAKQNSIIAFSSSAGKTASDTNERHSLFGQVLLESLQKSTIDIGNILKFVQQDISIKTQNKQIPYIENNMYNKVYLDQLGLSSPPKPIGIPTIKFHGYTFISMMNDIEKLKNMNTYVFFPDNISSQNNHKSKKYKRYEKVLELMQETPEYDINITSLGSKAKEINRFILMNKKSNEKR